MYQMLDEGFVGLIYSVFNEKKQTRVSSSVVDFVDDWSVRASGQIIDYNLV